MTTVNRSLDTAMDAVEHASLLGDDRSLISARRAVKEADQARARAIASNRALDPPEGPRRSLAVWLAWQASLLLRHLRRESPWLTSAATQWLDAYLSQQHSVIEWGAGYSTPWLDRRAGRLCSVEHDPSWHQRLCASLYRGECRLVPDGEQRIEAYVHAWDGHGPFDVAIIDGLHRVECLRACASGMVRRGGIVVIDNAEYMSRDGWEVPLSWQLLLASHELLHSTLIWEVR